MTARSQTFADVLAALLRDDAARPLVTFYDETTGERTELSVATYANWVAKTASLLVEELDLERGDRLAVDLPTHWLGPVFLGAAWSVGLSVDLVDGDEAADADPAAVVCGPRGLDRWAPRADAIPVVASALLPLGVRFVDPLPAGVRDFGVEVWSQPDSFVAWDPPTPQDPAVGGTTQAELLEAATRTELVDAGDRLLTVRNPASPSGLHTFTGPLVHQGSVVWVVGAGPDRIDALAASERVDVVDRRP